MGLIVPNTLDTEREDQSLPYDWFVGIDWGSEKHQVCVLDRDRRQLGERVVDHDGVSLAQLADWLWTLSASQPQRVAIAIEVPRGAIVKGLVDRGFHVFAINLLQREVPLRKLGDESWSARRAEYTQSSVKVVDS